MSDPTTAEPDLLDRELRRERILKSMEPTTAETPTMTDIERISEKSGCDKPYVRAIVAAMLEPSEGPLKMMLVALMEHDTPTDMKGAEYAFRSAIRHILDEPKD